MEQLVLHAPVLIIALPLLAAFITPVIGRFSAGWRNALNGILFTFVICLVALLAIDVYTGGMRVYSLGAPLPDMTTPPDASFPVRILLQVDGMSVFMAITITLVTLSALVYSYQFMKKETGQDGFYSLVLLLYTGMIGLVLTGDMFNLFVFFEILSIAGAGLVAYRVNRAEALEGSLKYVIISTISGLMVLFSIGLLYAQYNLLSIAALAQAIQYTTIDIIALTLLIVAFSLKLAAVPLHMWAPDTYSVAPAGVTPMIYTSSAASMYALYRVVFTLFGTSLNTHAIGWFIIILGVLSMLIGVLMAIYQTDIKRLMAYHAISQSGYMLLGLGVGLAVLTDPLALASYGHDAMNGGLFHLVNNALYKGMLFLTAEAIFFRIGTRDLNKMGGLGHNMKWTTVFFIIGALAIAGIPPMNGFASKLLIYQSVFQFNPLLSIIAMFVSLLTLASFAKVFCAAFTGPKQEAWKDTKEVPASMLAGMGIMAVCVIFMGLFPGVVIDTIITPATDALLDQAGYIGGVMGVMP